MKTKTPAKSSKSAAEPTITVPQKEWAEVHSQLRLLTQTIEQLIPVQFPFDPKKHKSWGIMLDGEEFPTWTEDETTEDGAVLETFATAMDARLEVLNHFTNCAEAVRKGEMDDTEGLDRYSIFPMTCKPGLQHNRRQEDEE